MNSSEFKVQSSEFRFSAFASGVLRTAALAVALPLAALNAAQVADLGRDGVGVTVESEPDAVDPARDFFVTVTVQFSQFATGVSSRRAMITVRLRRLSVVTTQSNLNGICFR